MVNATNWTPPSKTSTNWTGTSTNATNYQRRTYLSISSDTVTLDNDVYILFGYDPSVIDQYTNAVNWS